MSSISIDKQFSKIDYKLINVKIVTISSVWDAKNMGSRER